MTSQMPTEARYRAAELAAEMGISVQALRSYQSKGLLPPPRHEGRVAWYGSHHRDRLLQIRELKAKGWSLRMIAELLGDEDATPRGVDERAVLRLVDVAERSGVPVEVLRALEASGLLQPHRLGDGGHYSEADVRFVRQVLTLLGVGLSLDDLMRIARPLLDTCDDLGRDVIDAWEALVASRIRGSPRDEPGDDAEAASGAGARGRGGGRAAGVAAERAARVAASARALAAIVGQLVAYRVERAVLAAAGDEIAARGTPEEREALVRSLTAPEQLGGSR